MSKQAKRYEGKHRTAIRNTLRQRDTARELTDALIALRTGMMSAR